VLGEAAEAGRPVALSTRGFGLPGGDVGCPGKDLGEHVQQLCPFGGGEGGQDALLDGADPGQQLVGGGAAPGKQLRAVQRHWREILAG
jgi:hypothetical protein